MICTACGTPIPDTSATCPACGTPLQGTAIPVPAPYSAGQPAMNQPSAWQGQSGYTPAGKRAIQPGVRILCGLYVVSLILDVIGAIREATGLFPYLDIISAFTSFQIFLVTVLLVLVVMIVAAVALILIAVEKWKWKKALILATSCIAAALILEFVSLLVIGYPDFSLMIKPCISNIVAFGLLWYLFLSGKAFRN